jgi:hypothetical protein
MRKSTKMLGLAAVAGLIAIGGGSAFTASNTVPNSIAGFGEGTVSGATVTGVHYVPNATDPSVLDTVTFDDATDDLSAAAITLTLKDGSAATMGSPYTCSFASSVITCDVTSGHPSIATLAATDLTVVNQ